jgi:uncharacterized protein (UPF0261 family)
MFNQEGKVLYDEAANRAWETAMGAALSPEVELIRIDAHINEAAFADAVIETFLRLRQVAGS